MRAGNHAKTAVASSLARLALLLFGSAATGTSGCARPALADPEPPKLHSAPQFRATAEHCLASSQSTPRIENLSDHQLETVTRLLACVIETYQTANFDRFLEMRLPDVAHANREKSADILNPLLAELGIAGVGPGTSWTDGLRQFWRAYYATPPIDGFVAGGTRVRTERITIEASTLVAWDESFAFAPNGMQHIDHVLVIPHRRTLEEIVRRTSTVDFIDLDLQIERPDGQRGSAMLRYVWDPIDGEWFLHRALTRPEAGSTSDSAPRNLIL